MEETANVIEEVVEPQLENSEQEDPQEKNWRNLRQSLAEQKELSARQHQTIEELKTALSAIAQPKVQEEDPWEGLEDEEALEVRKAKEIFTKSTSKIVKKAVEEALHQHAKSPQALEQKARSSHSDFDSVMTAENIETILKKNPLVHRAILSSDDPFEGAYQYIVNSAAFANKQNASQKHVAEKAKFQENQKKPKSANEVNNVQAKSASGFAKLSKQQQAELWADHCKRLGRRP